MEQHSHHQRGRKAGEEEDDQAEAGWRVYLRGWAVRPHAASVWALISILQSLVVLCRWHRGDAGTVTEAKTLWYEGEKDELPVTQLLNINS